MTATVRFGAVEGQPFSGFSGVDMAVQTWLPMAIICYILHS